MKMGIERTLRQAFPQIKEVLAVDPTITGTAHTNLDQSSVLTIERVKQLLENLIPAIKGLGGNVEVIGANNVEGIVSIRFSGPQRLKTGVEGVLLDDPLINTVEFVYS